MTNHKHQLTLALEARHQSIASIAAIGDLFEEPDITPAAKIATARAIAHLALAAADLTRLRRELTHPGGQP
jgi:Holliday junction resolvasome RuvABC endonuclease subunit